MTRLGMLLIARSTRRLSLTAAGSVYLKECRKILDPVEAAETGLDAGRQRPRGLIRISLPDSFGQRHLASALPEFGKRYPDISLNMDFTGRRSCLIEEGIDLAIRITDRLGEQEVARRLGSARFIVAASPAFLRRCGEPRHRDDLTAHECLAYPLASSAPWPFIADAERLEVPIRGGVQPNRASVLLPAEIARLASPASPVSLPRGSSRAVHRARYWPTTRCRKSEPAPCCPATGASRSRSGS